MVTCETEGCAKADVALVEPSQGHKAFKATIKERNKRTKVSACVSPPKTLNFVD